MDIVEALASQSEFVRKAVQKAYTAEQDDEPIQNGKQRYVNVPKNTHFEFEFGGSDTKNPETFLYIERLHHEPGIEVMIWADTDWFDDDVNEKRSPEPSDGGETLEEFADETLEIVADVLESDSKPSYEYHSNAPPSLVFSATFFLPRIHD